MLSAIDDTSDISSTTVEFDTNEESRSLLTASIDSYVFIKSVVSSFFWFLKLKKKNRWKQKKKFLFSLVKRVISK